jgi:hypothetical protein
MKYLLSASFSVSPLLGVESVTSVDSVVERNYLGSVTNGGFTPSPSGVRAVFITIASIV